MYQREFSDGVQRLQVSGQTREAVDAFIESAMFREWLLRKDDVHTIVSLEVLALVPSSGKPIFGYVAVHHIDETGTQATHAILMRGRGVLVLLVLECAGKEYVALVEQARIAVGDTRCLELPGGLATGKIATDAALIEIIEETGIVEVEPEELHDLTGSFGSKSGVYGSPGLTDELVQIFLAKIRVTKETLDRLSGSVHGNEDENETTRVLIYTPEEALRATHDAKAKLALALYMLNQ